MFVGCDDVMMVEDEGEDERVSVEEHMATPIFIH